MNCDPAPVHESLGKLPVARIQAVQNNEEAAKASYDQAGGLDSVIYLATGCRVMLNVNLWTERELVNESLGSAVGMVYPENARPPSLPLCVVVQFDGYTGLSFSRIVPRIVLIDPFKRTWFSPSGKPLSRNQISLSLAHAATVHKAQGTTLPSVVLDLGKNEFAIGLSFVGCSRVRSLSDLAFLQYFDFDRLAKLANSPVIQEKVDVANGRNQTADRTRVLNERTLHFDAQPFDNRFRHDINARRHI
ncbi:hypothetical protein RvY_17359 [Ramazzottius varieornatus]|uniref:ATP-dependent DNA helicase n=1 Tax=Ramazzottius varieornatus TaxID=947166 RepID=A0A1D1W7S4_RAMVA|nr:hypothetical protein RvY_17359 [Ramazzottius varieornatus]